MRYVAVISLLLAAVSFPTSVAEACNSSDAVCYEFGSDFPATCTVTETTYSCEVTFDLQASSHSSAPGYMELSVGYAEVFVCAGPGEVCTPTGAFSIPSASCTWTLEGGCTASTQVVRVVEGTHRGCVSLYSEASARAAPSPVAFGGAAATLSDYQVIYTTAVC